jgi:Secretion system C-terminal sorting domain
MKKQFFFLLLLFCAGTVAAKKIKFAVDMRFQVKDSMGIHITGDFQDEAGFPMDWDPGTTEMFQDISDTNLYTVVLDIPAFQKYEFKFVNGIFGYQQEFVPVESRVNYNFIDSRWIYLDSLSNDTLEMAPICFADNAPYGFHLLRFYVDMQNVGTVSPNGVHVIGNFQAAAFSSTESYMYSFDGVIYEFITYVDSTMSSFVHEFRYLNGNVFGTDEVIVGACANSSGNRTTTVSYDLLLPTVCFAYCVDCASVGIAENSLENGLEIYPNPANHFITLNGSAINAASNVRITDITGKELCTINSISSSQNQISIEELNAGIYFLQVYNAENSLTAVRRFIVQ